MRFVAPKLLAPALLAFTPLLLFSVVAGRIVAERVLPARLPRLRRADQESGASAIEWAIISAIAVTLVVLIGGTIYKVVSDHAATLGQCGGQTADATRC